MIKFKELNKSKPYEIFKEKYDEAEFHNQKNIEAVLISSFCKESNEVDARYVNLKYIQNDQWIFFTNYESPKTVQFQNHSQICAVFYWNSINTQIRLKASIKKSDTEFSDSHFNNRTHTKNILAVSSKQSKIIDSYHEVKQKYNKLLNDNKIKIKRPPYWGGFSFMPYYFEFWHGHNSRLNERVAFEWKNNNWKKYFLEP